MPREIYSDGSDLVVRESQAAAAPPSLVFQPTETYAQLTRAEVEELHEALGRWLAR